ncbi:MAG: hypothetical protein ACYTAN_15035, partial [Planctomycetota bacterium]
GDLTLKVAPEGNVVSYEAEVIPSAGRAREHTIVLDVFDPAGEKNRLYSRNVPAKSGKAKGRIEFSLEGESGPWRLTFTEAASGISKSVEVMVP